MKPEDFHKYFSFCLSIGVKIYPKPIVNNGSIMKIVKNINNVEYIGEIKYSDNSIYEKIKEMYKNIYELNYKKENEKI